jgi:hypothetical protein
MREKRLWLSNPSGLLVLQELMIFKNKNGNSDYQGKSEDFGHGLVTSPNLPMSPESEKAWYNINQLRVT